MSSNDQYEWKIIENSWNKKKLGKDETLFTLANGHLGLRGDFDEPEPAFHRGTYINGFFEKEPIVYGEIAYGYAEHHETILNLPDPKQVRLYVNETEFRLDQVQLGFYQRYLDMKHGLLVRELEALLPNGCSIRLKSRRIVSFSRETLGALEYQCTLLKSPENKPVSIRVECPLEALASNRKAEKDPRVGSKFSRHPYRISSLSVDEHSAALSLETHRSGLAVGMVLHYQMVAHNDMKASYKRSDHTIVHNWEGVLIPGGTFTLYKYFSYNMGNAGEQDVLQYQNKQVIQNALAAGYNQLVQEQHEYLKAFWNHADILIDGDPEIQQAIRFNIFHILQSSGRSGKTSIAAKGLTGEGYEGHYFWDTEIYVCPLFTYTKPEIARSLLEYRYAILDKARQRAHTMAEKGALFPWRTIDGEETSAYYPAGTAQYHINADIVYAMEKYCMASGDREFLYNQAAEVAVETARLWLSLGHFGPDGKFRIDCVTGPDEYTALVNNNAYTNLMAKNNLLFACKTLGQLQKDEPNLYKRFCERLAIQHDEPEQWERVAHSMYIPFDAKTGIYPQDDSFMHKEPWPFDTTPRDKYPLLLHFHPLVIYRHQVLKQPDLVLAQFLLSEQFTLAEKIRNYWFYEKLTTGDSSLSHCIQSIMAAEIGDETKAYDYFLKTVRMDLDDVHGNSQDGIHTAAMAGSWLSIIYGFAGFRDRPRQGTDVRYSFNPRLPAQWKRLVVSLQLEDYILKVDVGRHVVQYSLLEKDSETKLAALAVQSKDEHTDLKGQSAGELRGLPIVHRNQLLALYPGDSVTISLKPVLRAVMFDLDGVITDTARLHFKAWKRLTDEQGWSFDEKLNENLKGISRIGSLEIILNYNKVSLTPEKKHLFAERKNSYYNELLVDLGPQDILPGIQELLMELGKKGVKRMIASASKNALRIINQLQLGPIPGPYFEGIVDPDSVTCGKPDPELFLQASERANVDPRDCIGIEDAQAGIDAIKAAGMIAIGVGQGLKHADKTIHDTRELSYSFLEKVFERY
ncbi:beta-phosphoglucomutase [Gracilinema caldarium]|uniref:Beta-phosphoglucomutase n=1 Tax=Gracilinema caldarium (strain ATCC 51460 / DSM 7334 / H1) TaxID=744872 RepID=F8F0C1_GRAC1|nr:beta-phosphoglucomutase [Gracilinema caldarium]AEJ18985.1 beta-phosphoglucomutase [Gracilinema caldarium DSM 7334]